MTSPSRKLTKAEARTMTNNLGTLVEERNGWKLYHGADILDEARGGTPMLRVNRAYATDGKRGTFWPMNKTGIAQAKWWFDVWSRLDSC